MSVTRVLVPIEPIRWVHARRANGLAYVQHVVARRTDEPGSSVFTQCLCGSRLGDGQRRQFDLAGDPPFGTILGRRHPRPKVTLRQVTGVPTCRNCVDALAVFQVAEERAEARHRYEQASAEAEGGDLTPGRGSVGGVPADPQELTSLRDRDRRPVTEVGQVHGSSVPSLSDEVKAHCLLIPGWATAVRQASGVTQARIAEELGVTRMAVSRWESGQRRPRGRLLVAYVELLSRLQREVDR